MWSLAGPATLLFLGTPISSRNPSTMCGVLYPAIILFFYTSCDARAVTQQTNDAEMLTDMFQKVNDLWHSMLYAIPIQNNPNGTAYAICNLQPNPKLNATEPKVTGQVLLKQSYPHGKLEANFILKGFSQEPGESTKAIHIHSLGDLSNGCDSTGGHYNPLSVNHPHHPGDFGNFHVQDGKIQQHIKYLDATLFGPYSVCGKSIVVHKLADDLGKGNNHASLENGNAGTRLACCVIGASGSTTWDNYMAMPGGPDSEGSE
ncbi:extracellular superoxide dismutase [Cu-Zn] isoform X2 [Pseudophryne corroboree]|uniref:extracellular superoxide dismutase [Cu-Zn] isoform X2 n=1 Tax=Pseudophryne corroboree TaxID=495146 RepID=UPI0030819AF5